VVNYSQRHWLRLNVKPGLTGEWQVSGRSHVKDFEQVVDLDLRYQKNWHPLYDLLVIAKTFIVIFGRVGAF
jgi:lipopolysaccharide/colanic/teichoic acid biosynthesis glycosyltransferase